MSDLALNLKKKTGIKFPWIIIKSLIWIKKTLTDYSLYLDLEWIKWTS